MTEVKHENDHSERDQAQDRNDLHEREPEFGFAKASNTDDVDRKHEAQGKKRGDPAW